MSTIRSSSGGSVWLAACSRGDADFERLILVEPAVQTKAGKNEFQFTVARNTVLRFLSNCCWVLGCLISLIGLPNAKAEDQPPVKLATAEIEFFEARVRPLLVKHCYECHSAESKKPGGGLLLDSRAGWIKGGDAGPAIEPGKLNDSLFVTAIRYQDDSLKMPPTGRLPDDAIKTLEEWIERGAFDPRTGSAKKSEASWETVFAERSKWWSLQPVSVRPVPNDAEDSWSRTNIDRFIWRTLKQEQLEPADIASPEVLIRRLHLVLIGLPPSSEATRQFVSEWNRRDSDIETRTPPVVKGSKRSEPAKNKLTSEQLRLLEDTVEQLLASPHFGERWARHWMDVVRFTETHGNEWNYEVHHAWRYRDYLIRAFNNDVPYDQFVREHVAGDLLPTPRRNPELNFNESIIGTAFYRFGEANHDDCIALRQIGYDLNDNQIDTLTKAFQGTTVACARCHDHKLDAISLRDYYALLGIIRSSRLVAHTLDDPQRVAPQLEQVKAAQADVRHELAMAWRADLEQLPKDLLAAVRIRQRTLAGEPAENDAPSANVKKWVEILSAEAGVLESPWEPLRLLLREKTSDTETIAAKWEALASRYEQEHRNRLEFNSGRYRSFLNRAPDDSLDWQSSGLGITDKPTRAGGLQWASSGDEAVVGMLAAGWYSHTVSSRLNGTLRSPVLPAEYQKISLLVMGQRSSAVRLVSGQCQLNYRNYRALINDSPHWITFDIPPDSRVLRTYAELVTMFNNPKFPDQLSALGGDTANYKLPWEVAAQDPRSFFGVQQVVLHNESEPPRRSLDHMQPLFMGAPIQTVEGLVERLCHAFRNSFDRWTKEETTDSDVALLDSLLRAKLIQTSATANEQLATKVRLWRDLDEKLPLPTVAPGFADDGEGFDQPMFARGESSRPGEVVPRGYIEVLRSIRTELDLANTRSPTSDVSVLVEKCPDPIESSTSDTGKTSTDSVRASGRYRLALQMASTQNPLTARVFVNRIWHHLFGAGLVRTVDDFGHLGELPSHPELLEYLAARFVEEGWSLKRLTREIVLSQTFLTSHRQTESTRQRDPSNRFLANYPARRLEAEGIRDSMLVVSGRIDRTIFGPSIQPYREQENSDRRLFPGPLDGAGRRSLYIKNNLMEAPRFLEAFNFPGGKVTLGRRDQTNVPGQALTLLNDPLVIQLATVWGERLTKDGSTSIEDRLERMFESSLSRQPTKAEKEAFVQAIHELSVLSGGSMGAATSDQKLLENEVIWRDLAHTLFNLQEFQFVP